MQDVHFGQETYQTVPLRRCNVSIQTEKDYLHVFDHDTPKRSSIQKKKSTCNGSSARIF